MTQVVLSVALGVLAAIGTYLVLRRDVVRMVWGVVILGQVANVYLVTMGGLTGSVPVLEHGAGHGGETAGVTDPLVQALVLTAIVIGFGTTAFALVLTYRVYQEHGTIDLRELGGELAPGQASASGAEADVATGSGIVEDEGSGNGAGDGTAADGGFDDGASDADRSGSGDHSPPDGGSGDARTDVDPDAGTNVETDAGTNAEMDVDTNGETNGDTDTGTDAGTDAGTNAGTGGGADG